MRANAAARCSRAPGSGIAGRDFRTGNWRALGARLQPDRALDREHSALSDGVGLAAEGREHASMPKANALTRFALECPVLWAVGTAVLVGVVGVLIFSDWRPAALGLVLMFAAPTFLWRPNGPGRRWAEGQRGQGA